MNTVRAKNDLRYISDVSNLVALIVLKIKDEFKNIELEKVKKNNELIVFIMELVEAGIIQDKIISKKLIAKLDKNKLVLDIFEAMFSSLTEDDKSEIEDKIQFILNNKVLRRNSFFFRFLRNLARRLRTYFFV
jgi:Asp-tRNA(Asn)/Glu-tRNA(Gln) amidotransferase B subunit